MLGVTSHWCGPHKNPPKGSIIQIICLFFFLLLVCQVIYLFCFSTRSAVTVCPSGGTPCDFSSIGAAISAAVSDTVINVQASSYSETSGPTTSLVPLTLSYSS
jgi:hypothetical protein